jgi:hypothetical protein
VGSIDRVLKATQISGSWVAHSRRNDSAMTSLNLPCHWHHTAAHEGGRIIRPGARGGPGQRWEFVMPDGSPHRPRYSAEPLLTLVCQ